jgi:hypothetical protein
MPPTDEQEFIALWHAGTETAAIAELSTYLRKHVMTDERRCVL